MLVEKLKKLQGYNGKGAATLSEPRNFSNRRPFYSINRFSQLIAQHYVRSRRDDLVINVKATGQKLFPVIGPALFHYEINGLGLTPFP
jgi:hypothetical protein